MREVKTTSRKESGIDSGGTKYLSIAAMAVTRIWEVPHLNLSCRTVFNHSHFLLYPSCHWIFVQLIEHYSVNNNCVSRLGIWLHTCGHESYWFSCFNFCFIPNNSALNEVIMNGR